MNTNPNNDSEWSDKSRKTKECPECGTYCQSAILHNHAVDSRVGFYCRQCEHFIPETSVDVYEQYPIDVLMDMFTAGYAAAKYRGNPHYELDSVGERAAERIGTRYFNNEHSE